MIHLFLILFTILIIYIYVSILKDYKLEQHDPLNHKLLELDICGWNLFHVFAYFMVCVLFDIRTIFGYMCVFLAGVIWYFFEKRMFMKYKKPILSNPQSKDKVYASISEPRPDDLVYNVFGILIHVYTRIISI